MPLRLSEEEVVTIRVLAAKGQNHFHRKRCQARTSPWRSMRWTSNVPVPSPMPVATARPVRPSAVESALLRRGSRLGFFLVDEEPYIHLGLGGHDFVGFHEGA